MLFVTIISNVEAKAFKLPSIVLFWKACKFKMLVKDNI